jgi:hypothetical protein
LKQWAEEGKKDCPVFDLCCLLIYAIWTRERHIRFIFLMIGIAAIETTPTSSVAYFCMYREGEENRRNG